MGTRGDVPSPGEWLTFQLFNDDFFLIHGPDGEVRCFVNRCAHQSARLVRGQTGSCGASLVCPNHQWSYDIGSGGLRAAPMMGRGFAGTEAGRASSLDRIRVREISGMLFACLGDQSSPADLDGVEEVISPYTAPFGLERGGYKLAHHHRETVPANWLLVMINNRECCHCRVNHKGLMKLFDSSSFNGASSPAYDKMFSGASRRWDELGLAWEEQAFEPIDYCRVARYPMLDGCKSITFDGEPASKKLIGGWDTHDSSTLSMWFNPNAWVHFTSDHIATNWVLPIDGEKCELYTSWIVREDAVEGEDYNVDHLTSVWRVTNSEDVELCNSMTRGAQSDFHRSGPFSEDERFCKQFCDWYMRYSG
ncbi:MAG: aromatic ring-hydroxylating dioxygenase subunit alpha [Acidimicrobiales bacterium]